MLYDRIGASYNTTRREDPRIAALIVEALGDARSVVNVGAGTGAYEPTDRDVVAIEPSAKMIAQRAWNAARAIRASAEQIPLADRSVDAAMAVNTLQHWTDVRAGLRELRRIARKRIVIFLRHGEVGTPFWLFDEYFPSIDRSRRISTIVSVIHEELPSVTARTVLFPCDCSDGVGTAYWNRPEMYLDEEVRKNISNFAMADRAEIEKGVERLRSDLASGKWDRRHGHLRAMNAIDLGHRILIAEL